MNIYLYIIYRDCNCATGACVGSRNETENCNACQCVYRLSDLLDSSELPANISNNPPPYMEKDALTGIFSFQYVSDSVFEGIYVMHISKNCVM